MALGPLAQIHVSVSDIDASIAFYRDVLGVTFLYRVPDQPMAFFQSGDTRLYLGAPEVPEFRSRVVLYFRVDDIELEYGRLLGAGVTFLDRPHVVARQDDGELWMAFLQDPDGHHIAIMQDRPTA